MLAKENIEKLIEDFLEVVAKSGVQLRRSDIEYEILGCPHNPPTKLPHGKMAVYMFTHSDRCPKVGKVGPNSQPRYTSHHYNPSSSGSNLSKSIVNDPELSTSDDLNMETVGDWVKKNTLRINFLLDAAFGIPVLNLLEAFLQCHLHPKFEGFGSQA
jgi:hypothetical protein